MNIRTLQQRMVVFILLPVGVILTLLGVAGFFYARDIMMSQWRESAVLKLQRAAHHIDMRLEKPLGLLGLLSRTAGLDESESIRSWILSELETLEGVTSVRLEWDAHRPENVMPIYRMGRGSGRMMRFHRANVDRVTNPVYDPEADGQTVDLLSQFKDETGKSVGSLRVTLRFDFLIRDMGRLGWWQSDAACLVDEAGTILIKTDAMEDRGMRLGETGDPLEKAVVEGIGKESHGTLLGEGHPPQTVAGYAHLENAPWALVLFAPGRAVLDPIVRFRSYYMAAGGLSVVLILLLIRFAVGSITESVRRLSRAAQEVSEGRYGNALPVKTEDEIGGLTRSFNAMVEGLRERDIILNTFGRYMDEDIARELMRRPEAHSLEGEKREVAILMSDIRGFTPMTETLDPEATLGILNLYFTHMIEVIKRHRGIIVDFIGDGILVFFDPLDGPLAFSLEQAVQCALDMQSEMRIIQSELASRGLPRVETGIGVNAGPVVVGTIGSETRAKYGIVGSTVNLTQRIQAEAGPGEAVVSQAVVSGLSEPPALRRSFEVRPKGVSRPLTLHILEESGEK